jgi:hypothetical protein
MISGFVLRNGQNGTQNLTTVGRTNIPAWAARLYNVPANQIAGPAVSTSYPLGRYLEDNDYLGDLGYVKGTDYDLDEYNGRFCVTPEFPGGTYAYFVSINAAGAPAFPYNIGRAFYGVPTGGSVSSISEAVTTNFVGGSSSALKLQAPARQAGSGNVTLTWSSVEGGTYQMNATSDFQTWSTNTIPLITATGVVTSATEPQAAQTNASRFYRVARTALATAAN